MLCAGCLYCDGVKGALTLFTGLQYGATNILISPDGNTQHTEYRKVWLWDLHHNIVRESSVNSTILTVCVCVCVWMGIRYWDLHHRINYSKRALCEFHHAPCNVCYGWKKGGESNACVHAVLTVEAKCSSIIIAQSPLIWSQTSRPPYMCIFSLLSPQSSYFKRSNGKLSYQFPFAFFN